MIARQIHRIACWITLIGCLAWTSHAGVLISHDALWRYFKGTQEPTPGDPGLWRQVDYDDQNWFLGRAPYSYGQRLTTGTELRDMMGNYSTVYLRTAFDVSDPDSVRSLRLHAAVDDGFIVWLNGIEVARFNVGPGERPFNDHQAPDRNTTSLPHPIPTHTYPLDTTALRAGENVLAVHLINVSLYSDDILLDAELHAVIDKDYPPFITTVTPARNTTVQSLDSVTVVFNEAVSGVQADDLLVNGEPATQVSQVNAFTYSFRLPPLQFGRLEVSWQPNHEITDRAYVPNRFEATAEGATWTYEYVDPAFPSIARTVPPQGHTVASLNQVEVWFSKPVVGVVAQDLQINGVPALSVSGIANGPYIFQFDPPEPGAVQLEFRDDHTIQDFNPTPLSFVGGQWAVELNPDTTLPTLRINEFMAANASGIMDEDGDRPGWIEIVNYGDEPVSLQGYALTDRDSQTDSWVFPDRTLQPGQYLVVFASGKDRRPAEPEHRLHTDFRLSRWGEYLALLKPESPRVAVTEFSPSFPEQRNDISFGQTGEGDWAYHLLPTPGSANSGPLLEGVSEGVNFSITRGVFDQAVEVCLTSPTPGAVIRYTRDGSEPTLENGSTYEEPIRVSWTGMIRATSFAEGKLPSPVETHSYIINPSAALRQVPLISLVTDTNNLVGRTGIVGMEGGRREGGVWVAVNPTDYFNPMNRGFAWERPVSVEFLNAHDGSSMQVDAGLRLHASAYFRPRVTPTTKFSWRLYFRRDYGAGKLRHPFLESDVSTVDEFDALVCRAGSNDQNPFIKDELVRRLYADCGQISALGRIMGLFMNGRFGGVYNPVERVNSDFMQIHHGGGPDWDVLSQGGSLDGSTQNFDAMMQYVRSNDPAQTQHYQHIGRWLDVTNFVDYLLVNAYGFNGDWPHNNWRAARERREDALWRFYVWDAEWSFGTYGRSIAGNTFSELTGSNPIATLYQRLRRHPEFRRLFADRAHRHLFNGGALTEERVRQRAAQLYAATAPLLPGMDRSITNSWIRQRPQYLHQHLQQAGLWGSTDAPVFSQHGGIVMPGFRLTMTHPGGSVWYTTNGTDPRVPFTGTISNQALRYDPDNPPVIDQGVQILARTQTGSAWSALTDASFQVEMPGSPIRITEIQFNPFGGAALEFLEFANISGAPVDLSGYTFDGIQFRVPTPTFMPPGAVWILASARDTNAFAARYPGVQPFGYFGGALNNSGETIRIQNAVGVGVEEVTYRPDQGWPEAAAQDGHSLVRVNLHGDPDDPGNWVASPLPGGHPGSMPALPAPPVQIRIDEILTSNRTAVEHRGGHPDYLELLSLESDAVELEGFRLRRADRTSVFEFPPGIRLEPGSRLVVWCDNETVPGELHAGFALNRAGGTLFLENPEGHRIHTLSYGPQPTDYSLGYLADGTLTLVHPSPGEPNEAVLLGDTASVVFNEWLLSPGGDQTGFLELFNPNEEQPIALQGWSLHGGTRLHVFHRPSFLAPQEFLALWLDTEPHPTHLAWIPEPNGMLEWRDPQGFTRSTQQLSAGPAGVSMGYYPDGEDLQLRLGQPTPANPNLPRITEGPRFNEVLALQSESDPSGWIELFNPGTTSYNLAGAQLVLTARQSQQWTFPSSAQIPAGGFLLVYTGETNESIPANSWAIDGMIPRTGAALQLFGARGELLDELLFGHQLPGESIGWIEGSWRLLTMPTPDRPNAPAQSLGNISMVKINEWLSYSSERDDFIELFNASLLPVDLGGHRLTDDPSLAGFHRFVIPPLTLVAGGGWVEFIADNRPDRGPMHMPFGLSRHGEMIRFYNPSGGILDQVTVLPHDRDTSFGRFPDGGEWVLELPMPTPGAANGGDLDSDGDGMPDIWEILHGLDPFDPSDAHEDPDGDGATNLQEYLAGTDPNDPNSVLALRKTKSLSGYAMRFEAMPGRSYSVLVSDNPVDPGSWTVLHQVPATPQQRWFDFLITVSTETPQMYYRVSTPQWPWGE